MTIPVKLPKEVLSLFPMWEYRCPSCGTYVESDKSFCPNCEMSFDEKTWRVPSRFLKSHDAMSEYAHKVLAPKLTPEQRELLFHYFTELFSDGFESGDFSEWTGTLGSPTVVNSPVHHGSYAMQTDAQYEGCYVTFTPSDVVYSRVYWRYPSGGGWSRIFSHMNSSNNVADLFWGWGKFRLWHYDSIGDWTYTEFDWSPDVDTWYCIELYTKVHASEGEHTVFVDDAEIGSVSSLANDVNGNVDQFRIRAYSSDVRYYDCVVVADMYIGPEEEGATYTKTWNTDVLFKKMGIIVGDERKSTVATDTDIPYATQATFQRKTFYANGRFWVFYAAADNNIVFRTSTDGLSWSSETVVRVGGSYGPNVSVFFDGTYVHYAANSTGSYPWDSALYYRRGTPNSNGTITWSAVEQTVNTDYDKATNPAIAVDSNGYVWIGYREYVNGERCPFVIKSGNNDGTWGTTPAGFPYQLSATETSYWVPIPVPLTSGKMLVIYAHHLTADYGKQIKMRAWTGSSWLDEVTTTSGIYHSMHHSAVAEGDNVHIVFCKFISAEDPMEIVYVKYSYSSNSLGSETTLQGSIPYTETYSDFSVPIIAGSNGKLYVFWANYPSEDHLYYRKWNGSSWESAVDWIDESSEMFSSDSWTCFYQAYDGYIGVLYETKQSSPYNVKFACMSRVVTVDALFKKPGISKSLSIDAAIQKQDIVDTFAVDVALQKALLETYDVNALFRKHGIEKTADVDVLLQKLDILATFGVDVNFLKQNIIKSFGVDARFGALVTQEISRQIDVLFKKLDILETFGVDIDFLKRNVIKSFTLDICFSALMTQTISKQIDVLLKMLDATKTFGLDVYFGPVEAQAYVKTFALDVMFAYKVRLPELWLDENGKIVLNISKPYTWVGT